MLLAQIGTHFNLFDKKQEIKNIDLNSCLNYGGISNKNINEKPILYTNNYKIGHYHTNLLRRLDLGIDQRIPALSIKINSPPSIFKNIVYSFSKVNK